LTTERIARDRAFRLLGDIKESIGAIRSHLSGKTIEYLRVDRWGRAAFERFLEVLCEAARHLPDARKNEHPYIPWRDVADLGNRLRHAYRHLDIQTLWDIYQRDLDTLERAVDTMLALHTPKGGAT
jgi:uncharacterized protein with HEPN domain